MWDTGARYAAPFVGKLWAVVNLFLETGHDLADSGEVPNQNDHVHGPQAASGRALYWADFCWTVVRMVAVVLAGIWAFVLYTAYQKDVEVAKLEASRLEQEQREHDLTYATTATLRSSLVIDSRRRTDRLVDGLAEYEVQVRLEIINESQVPIRVSLTVLDFFVGTLPAEWRPDKHVTSIVPLGTPKGRWDLGGSPGVLKWKRHLSIGGINDDSDIDDFAPRDNGLESIEFVVSNLLCSDLDPGEVTTFSDIFLLSAPQESYLYVVLSGHDSANDRWLSSSRIQLP